MTTVEILERKISRCLRKWVGIPPSFTNIGLYCKTAKLQLPFQSLVEEYKIAKARAQGTLDASDDSNVRQSATTLPTGRKWNVSQTMRDAESRLRHKDLVGVPCQGTMGLGYLKQTRTKI